MIPSFESRHSLGGRACPQFGGDSSSSSSAIQNTTNTLNDSRSVTNNDNHAVNLSNSGNTYSGIGNGNGNTNSFKDAFNTTTTITTTDQGAVAAGKAVATAALANNATNTSSLMAVAEQLFSKTKDTTDANLLLAGSLSSGAQKAYSDATSQATGSKTIMLVALASVVIVVGLAVYRK